MPTLHEMLATRVLAALRDHEHVVVVPAGGAALCAEVASIIAPTLAVITPHLSSTRVVDGEPTTTFGHELADDAVEGLVAQIAERLMDSNHVDDIFADDRIIKRDAFRAIRDTLLGYARGEIEVDDRGGDDDGFDVALRDLGYVVATVAAELDAAELAEALDRAAESVGATMLELHADRRGATFDLLGGAEVGRLALEEAITDELTDLVEQQQVALPSLEQVFSLQDIDAREPAVQQAMATAASRTRARTDCAAAWSTLDRDRVAVALTPLSAEAAVHAQEHFEVFLALLEEQLAVLARETRTHEPRPAAPEAAPDTSATSPSDGCAPESTRSPRRRQSPRAQGSRTRAKRHGRSPRRAKG